MKEFFLAHKKIIIITLIAASTTLSAIGSYFYFSKQRTNNYSLVLSAQMERDVTQIPPEDLKTLTILLLGYGGAGHQGGFLTDVIQLIHLDFDKAQVSMISVPRDLWIKLPNGKQAKINTAFSLGNDPNQPVASGGKIAKQMATAVTGLPINYFMAIDFVGFKRLVGETLDGIRVDVPETLDDPWYPIKGEELNPCGMTPGEVAEVSAKYSGFELERQFACRYEHLHFEKGPVEMEGKDALAYVRSRHGSTEGDFSRSQRQHALLNALRDKLWSIEALETAPEFFQKANQHVVTDIDLEIVKYLVPALKATKDFETKTVVLSTENVFMNSKSSAGAFIVVPRSNWEAVHSYVQQQL